MLVKKLRITSGTSFVTCTETWTSNEGDLSRIRAGEMSFFVMAVGLGKMEGYSNRELYKTVMEERRL